MHHHYTELADTCRTVEDLDPVFERRLAPFGPIVRKIIRRLACERQVNRPQFQTGAFHCRIETFDPSIVLLLRTTGQITRPGFDPANTIFVVCLLICFGSHRTDSPVDRTDLIESFLP